MDVSPSSSNYDLCKSNKNRFIAILCIFEYKIIKMLKINTEDKNEQESEIEVLDEK